MAEPDWLAFAGASVVFVGALLALATGPRPDATTGDADPASATDLSVRLLVVNAVVVHGAFGGLVTAAAWVSGVPATALGLPASGLSGWVASTPVGVAAGGALFVANEAALAASRRLGSPPADRARSMLAPDGVAGWLLVLAVVLPVTATVEELLFRGVLVGALSAGFGVSPWLLAAASGVAFGVAHGAQGASGVAVTALLGSALAGVFVVTGSLVVVAVAHWFVNALALVVHEGLEVAWSDRGRG